LKFSVLFEKITKITIFTKLSYYVNAVLSLNQVQKTDDVLMIKRLQYLNFLRKRLFQITVVLKVSHLYLLNSNGFLSERRFALKNFSKRSFADA